MSNKSGIGDNVVALPSGGGAISGMGEKFSPDLFTGTGNFSVPIAIPEGRNGFQPSLTLGYSTGNGNGPFGQGWGLSVPGIMRKTNKGVPLYDSSKDVFILSGSEDLIPVSESVDTVDSVKTIRTIYRPRTEGLFARITHFEIIDTSSGTQYYNYWEVRSKDGLISYYGNPDLERADLDNTIIADPSDQDRSKIFAWKLYKTVDPFGNTILYSYLRDFIEQNLSNSVEGYDQLYLNKIQYVDWDDSGTERFLISVNFLGGRDSENDNAPLTILEVPDRPDAFSSYNSGFQVRTRKRYKEIVIRTHPKSEDLPDHYSNSGYDIDNGIQSKSYLLNYLDEDENLTQALNNSSLLKSVQVKGWDKDPVDGTTDISEEMPPLVFDYTKYSPEQRDFFPIKGKELPNVSLATPTFELIDLDGNGLPDVIEMNGAYIRYWTNRGNGTFDLPRLMGDAPSGFSLEDQNVQLVDADGDGRADLLVNKPGISGYFPLNFDGKWDQGSFVKQELAPSFSFSDPEVKMLDINGDGITDVLRNGSRLECFFQDREEGWNETRFVNRSQADNFPNVSFADPSVKTADMNGDGLQDIVIVKNGSLVYWPSKGHGNWGHRVQMKNMGRLGFTFKPERLLLGDLDGDGLADMAYIENNKITIWINQQGEYWSDPIEINGTPAVNDLDSVRIADILGQGTPGILWTSDGSYQARNSWFFLDLTGGTKPYILQEMDNNMGAVTKVKYESSVVHYQRDFKNPNTRWQTTLPFPVQVVSCVEVIDKISKGKLATEYEYHHGYWDGGEREFRGFGRVDQFDTETFQRYNEEGLHGAEEFEAVSETSFSPPLHTKSWFYLGPVGSEYGDWKIPDFSKEYFVDPDLSGDDLAAYLDRDIDSFKIQDNLNSYLSSMPRRARRDAHRALRGSSLRTELFALDGSALEARPYTVTEQGFEVRKEFEPEDFTSTENSMFPIKKNWGSAYVFFSMSIASRTTQWERGKWSENHHSFSFTRNFDDYGNAQELISAAVPRGRDFSLEDLSYTGDKYLATYSETTYGYNDTENSHYIVDRVCSKKDFEIDNDGTQSLSDLIQATFINNNTTVIAHAISFYDGSALADIHGASFGVIGEYGVLKRTSQLVISQDVISNVYGTTPVIYLDISDSAWNSYSEVKAVEDITKSNFTLHSSAGTAGYVNGYYQDLFKRVINTQGQIVRDYLSIKMYQFMNYDAYGYKLINEHKYQFALKGFLANNKIESSYSIDYRVLQPFEIEDPNLNHSRIIYSPLGFVKSKLLADKSSYSDTEADPSIKIEYDFFNFVNNGNPVFVKSTSRENHKNDAISDNTYVKYEYSDGFGRLLQTRQQAEDTIFGATANDRIFGDSGLNPDPDSGSVNAEGTTRDELDPLNVVVSGWQVYDNKGQVIEKYEPFFDSGFDYANPTEIQKGAKVQMFYDPRGQVVKTLNPDGSMQKVIFGVPGSITTLDLESVDDFEPTPWESYTYDANDLAGITHATESGDYDNHWYTPLSATLDALGRQVETRQRMDDNASNDIVMQYEYDIRGNVLTITDALSRTMVTNKYAEANWLIEEDHIDSGVTTYFYNYLHKPKHIVRANGSESMIFFDAMGREVYLWAKDYASDNFSIRQYSMYGEHAIDLADQTLNNHRGRIYKLFDGAGLLENTKFDFKGNLVLSKREVIKDSVLNTSIPGTFLDLADNAFHVAYDALIPSDFSTTGNVKPTTTEITSVVSNYIDTVIDYLHNYEFDALNRPTVITLPKGAHGSRRKKYFKYNNRGLVSEVNFNNGQYSFSKLHYNAKGQKILSLSIKLMKRYVYDQETFRLKRVRAWVYQKPTGTTNEYEEINTSNWNKKLDYSYDYDLVGNILSLRDTTPSVFQVFGPGNLTRQYVYDPTYKLISASGRECDTPLSSPPWVNNTRCYSATATRLYRRDYSYDKMGNIEELDHVDLDHGTNSFTRRYNYISGQNLLDEFDDGNDPSPTVHVSYDYDSNGNQIKTNSERHFTWNHQNQMSSYFNQTSNGAEPTVYSLYLYDTFGQRVKKWTKKKGSHIEVTNYIESDYEHMYETNLSLSLDTTNNVDFLKMFVGNDMFNSERFGTDTKWKAGRYSWLEYIHDQVGSVALTFRTNTGYSYSREECFPFGEQAFGIDSDYTKKRYRFAGKERDEDHGLYYFGARYYAPWTCRFTSVDPLANQSPHQNPYHYSSNNPINRVDPSGMKDGPSDAPKANQTTGTETTSDDFFDQSGNPLGSVPSDGTNNIRVLNKGVDPLSLYNDKGQIDQSKLEQNSSPITDVKFEENSPTLNNITKHYAQGIVKNQNVNFGTTNSLDVLMSTEHNPKQINVGINSEGNIHPLLGDKNNFKNTLVHENVHLMKHEGKAVDVESAGGAKRHLDAYVTQTDHETFANTTEDFQDHIFKQIGRFTGYLEDKSLIPKVYNRMLYKFGVDYLNTSSDADKIRYNKITPGRIRK